MVNNMTHVKKRRKEAEKAIEEQDAKWESVHGISRHDHQRFLNAPYDDFESNAEYVRFMRINELRKREMYQRCDSDACK